ncbi:MAG: S8 family peptidase [Sphingobacteriaceae bacterium]
MKNLIKITFGFSLTIFLAACQKEQLTTADQVTLNSSDKLLVVSAQGANEHEMVANQLLVKFKAGTSTTNKNNAFKNISASVVEHIHTKAMKNRGDVEGVYLLRSNLNALEAISKAKGNIEIEYAEPNYIYQHHATSVDPYFTNGSLWGMNGTYGSKASVAWEANHTGSENVYIGVIDEGAMYTHEDLSANFWVNPYEIAGNNIDDDGNGYIDDIRGWDFAGNNNTTYDGTADDHGTHVSGTIGASANSKGVVGVNWNVTLITGKFLGANGGSTANAIKAVDYFTDLKTRHGLNIVATSNSWGGGGYSSALAAAIERANAAGILFVAAAGNASQNIDVTPSYPASYTNSNIISVASITSTGGLSSFSNYGATSVDIGAPGSGIYSTLPGQKNKSAYGSYSGTSMATPHVSGACALYASTHPTATAAQIKAAVLAAATSTSSLSGKTVTGGRLNVSTF